MDILVFIIQFSLGKHLNHRLSQETSRTVLLEPFTLFSTGHLPYGRSLPRRSSRVWDVEIILSNQSELL